MLRSSVSSLMSLKQEYSRSRCLICVCGFLATPLRYIVCMIYGGTSIIRTPKYLLNGLGHRYLSFFCETCTKVSIFTSVTIWGYRKKSENKIIPPP